ncbi:hypothetical protein GWI33_000884 [Rhynchophorus ferrugineus]|uniref:Transposase IS110-like N-terminal domain-containing protein n=1 Tax=Rhynchophorus ferrugineus TaxID=354439 RepID=A0A834IAX4_RHYFE|nr:hypothetical protein GWI33_000884 [Rhynchophorus ferrugineus]
MIAAKVLVGIDVSRDWLDGFLLPRGQRFRLPNSAEGHAHLIEILQNEPSAPKVGFEATGGQEWALWKALVRAGVNAVQLPPAQIKAFARSHGTRAKTDRIDAKLIAGFMAFRPEAGRTLPTEKLQILRTLTTRRAQLVGMRKRLVLQISSRRRQAIPAHVDNMDDDLKALLDAQILELERWL